MAEVVALRIDLNLLKKVDEMSKDEHLDRSSIIRKLIDIGYQELRREKAAKRYVEGKITLSEAAHIAGLSLLDMEHYLVDKGVKSQYSIEDLENEMKLLS